MRVWNDDLTATEQANAFAGTSFNTGDQVLYLAFLEVMEADTTMHQALTANRLQLSRMWQASPSLQLSQFSVAAWFKTSTNFGSEAFIVNKGGFGSDSAGQNMNYEIWMNSWRADKSRI